MVILNVAKLKPALLNHSPTTLYKKHVELKVFTNEQAKVQLCTPVDIFGHKKTCNKMLQVK